MLFSRPAIKILKSVQLTAVLCREAEEFDEEEYTEAAAGVQQAAVACAQTTRSAIIFFLFVSMLFFSFLWSVLAWWQAMHCTAQTQGHALRDVCMRQGNQG